MALSAQATDKGVNKATEKLFAVADTPQKMFDLGVEGLTPYIASIGLYRNKAKNVIALSKIILEQHGGQTPLNREDLQALPGVGRKTASVVLNELDIEPAIAVDTHVFRVAHRLKLSSGKTPDKVEQDLMAIIPGPWQTRAHHWLILHGRYIWRRPQTQVRGLLHQRPVPLARAVHGRLSPGGGQALRASTTAWANRSPPSGAWSRNRSGSIASSSISSMAPSSPRSRSMRA